MSVRLTITLDEELHKRLEARALELDRSLSWLLAQGGRYVLELGLEMPKTTKRKGTK